MIFLSITHLLASPLRLSPHLAVPVSLLHLSPLSPWSVFPPTPFFSIEVSLAVVDLNTWSSLFSHSVPSSHSASIFPPSFLPPLWLSSVYPYSHCLFTHLFLPLGWPRVHSFKNDFPHTSVFAPSSCTPPPHSSSPQGGCLLPSFINSFPPLHPFLVPFLHPPCAPSLSLKHSSIALVLWKTIRRR